MVGARILLNLALFYRFKTTDTALVTCFSNDARTQKDSCSGERCYKNNTHNGCTDIASCTYLENAVDCKRHDFPCCCQLNWCNELESKNSVEEGSMLRFWPHIVLLLLASTASIAFMMFFVFQRRFKKRERKGRTKFLLELSKSQRPIPDNTDTSSRARRNSSPKKRKKQSTRYGDPDCPSEPLPDMDDVIDQIDLTDMKVEAVINSDVREKIAQCLRNGPRPLKAQRIFENPPRIVKVVTYGTSEHITLLESPEPINASKTQFTSGQHAAEDMLTQLLDNGPREFHFDRLQLQEVLRLGAEIFLAEDTLLEVPLPCTVYGDTHGQYSDLLRWFNLNGWPHETRSVFLGDFVDRGSHGVELFTLITCLKICFPDNIFVIRGNHEEESLNQIYSFVNEVHFKFDGKTHSIGEGDGTMYKYFKNVFVNLPLACLIGGDILAMHGGISPLLRSLKDIQLIERPIEEFVKGTLACDLVWSDPDTFNYVEKYEPNYERESTVGIGQLFSKSAVKETCKRLGIKMIIRGHQAPLHGYASWAGGRLITLFSAPAYKGSSEDTVNMGACIEAPLKVSEAVRKKRELDTYSREQVQAHAIGGSQSEFADILPVSHASNLAIDK
ncbi:hypothetical protein RB195_014525 [Necator americanus]|uniref:Serine/threonine-protein phosphatase n=1 Tax=Necator americanus TaxID=51031 RepID=A0ABR1E1Q4_NECAM